MSAILFENLWSSAKAARSIEIAKTRSVLIVCGDAERAPALLDDLAFFKSNALDFPAWETLPHENINPSADIVGLRYETLRQCLESTGPRICVTNLQAVLQRVISPDHYCQLHKGVSSGDEIAPTRLCQHFEKMGYVRCPVAADKGQFAVRGSLIDIFPVNYPHPFRLDFCDDTVESIRIFDPASQRSIRQEGALSIAPAVELELLKDKEDFSSILDYMGDCTVVFDNLSAIEDHYLTLKAMPGALCPRFASLEAFLKECVDIEFWAECEVERLSPVEQRGHNIAFEVFGKTVEVKRKKSSFRTLPQVFIDEVIGGDEIVRHDILRAIIKEKDTWTCECICSSSAEQKHFCECIAEMGLSYDGLLFTTGYLSSSLVLLEEKRALISYAEVFERYKVRRSSQRSSFHSIPQEFFELKPGDLVVHLHNGIGRFLGQETKKTPDGKENEYMALEYASGAKLYVPMAQSFLISKYIGQHDALPQLHQLGSKRFEKQRQACEQSILGYASDLLASYAQREVAGGTVFALDTEEMQSFAQDFAYVETADQLRAIEDVTRDLESTKAMDRLVCGDVGFGKTEVAMRAAAKAVLCGGKQVAVLVPTTMLALQHYETFCARMKNFPFRIAQLSRFCSAKEKKEALKGIEEGSIDIVIGTLRILSKDVHFANLGLVIVDEEQRFGVKSKEALKSLRAGVDCLTMSATPIPRTLHMSMIGARDISVIATPPQDRIPIKAAVVEKSGELIKNAISRELLRDGQVFFVHNCVETIYETAEQIRILCPQARILVGHGQMDGDEIETVFHAFKEHRADVLVATTIIENGIDIPNANTLIVDNAQRFGLAELYQLRGRVGRWNRRAYAYFLTPKTTSLSELASQRLFALMEAGGYGGGMKIAMRDLEIRGAGDILGIEQSGHVGTIGFHLYCKLLKRAIKALQNKSTNVQSTSDCVLKFPQDARLPPSYINASSLRMELYQRLGEAESFQELQGIIEEIVDRFGSPPVEAQWLFAHAKIRAKAQEKCCTTLSYEEPVLSCSVQTSAGLKKLQRLLDPRLLAEPFYEQVGAILSSL